VEAAEGVEDVEEVEEWRGWSDQDWMQGRWKREKQEEVQDQTGSERRMWERQMRQEEWGPRRPKAEEKKGMRLEREAEEGASPEALR
jgi:hypothetical protein